MGRLDDNTFVQAYWSNADNQCVIPTQKFVKDNKDNKDNKESKEYKDHKDHKERGKEGKDAKEKDRDLIIGRSWIDVESSQSAGETGRPGASGQAFIRPDERPAVGEQALTNTHDVKE